MDTDKTWEYYGASDPYFGVLTSADFKSDRMSYEARTRFFESGQRYIELVMDVVREKLDASFQPARALDFGCGVGRLALPLARLCESVVGVDVSDSMLEHARGNASSAGLTNVSFAKSDDTLSKVSGTFDFLNSLIVFQHIPPPRGEAILRKLLSLLRDGGVGALHFTYGFDSATPLSRHALVWAYTTLPLVWNARNLLKGRPFGEPMMQMNQYDLNRLFRILQEEGCHIVHSRFTETGSYGHAFYGVILFFQKKRLNVGEHA
jgi:SAM-dependent methyltransferase